MWQSFTERSRRVMFFAQEEARQRGTHFVSTEHVLLGLVRDEENVAVRLLRRMEVSPEVVRAEVERRLEGQTDDAAASITNPAQDMHLTPRAKRVIDLAYDEARQPNNHIGTEHLLLGLIREAEGLAGQVLSDLGVTLESARGEVMALKGAEPDAWEALLGGAADQVQRAAAEVKRRLTETGEGAESPAVGDLGTLRGAAGRAVVEVAPDIAAYCELAEAFLARDAFAYRELRDAGRFLLVPAGTGLKRLLSDPKTPARRETPVLLVRVLDGEFAGCKGWIAPDAFERVGPDEAPFPPED